MDIVLNTHTSRVCASPAVVASVLRKARTFEALTSAFEALGLADAVSIRWSDRVDPASLEPVAVTLTWLRQGTPHIEVTWRASVSGWADGDTALTIDTRAVPAASTAPTVAAALPLVGPIVDSQTARWARAICALAEEDETP